MQNKLDQIDGYTFESVRHAQALIEIDFPEVIDLLHASLSKMVVHKSDVVQGGGGLSSVVQGFGIILKENGWHKQDFDYVVRINDKIAEQFKFSSDFFYLNNDSLPGIAIVIEWNNKDAFYDRDLENFKRMHKLGLISAGILITRGESLQDELLGIFYHFLSQNNEVMEKEIHKQKGLLEKVQKKPNNRLNITAKALYNSKFGQATTHWDKLIARVNNRVGDPCPFLLVGIEKERLI